MILRREMSHIWGGGSYCIIVLIYNNNIIDVGKCIRPIRTEHAERGRHDMCRIISYFGMGMVEPPPTWKIKPPGVFKAFWYFVLILGKCKDKDRMKLVMLTYYMLGGRMARGLLRCFKFPYQPEDRWRGKETSSFGALKTDTAFESTR